MQNEVLAILLERGYDSGTCHKTTNTTQYLKVGDLWV